MQTRHTFGLPRLSRPLGSAGLVLDRLFLGFATARFLYLVFVPTRHSLPGGFPQDLQEGISKCNPVSLPGAFRTFRSAPLGSFRALS